MFGIKWVEAPLVVIATFGLLCPQAAGDEGQAGAERAIHDVRLDQGGSLQVVVVDAQGQPQETTIRIARSGTEQVLVERTNQQGACLVRNLVGGMYRLQTSEGICLCRVWTNRAAPPIAAERLLIVNDRTIQRGQRPVREMFRSDPIVMTALVAAAIAIPIAIHKSRDNDASGS